MCLRSLPGDFFGFQSLEIGEKNGDLAAHARDLAGNKVGRVNLHGGQETGDIQDFGHEGFPELAKCRVA